MRLLPSDPDIATLVARIEKKDINLQPDFQRGEVWSDSKRRKLIDTILREWHVPPIHVIERENAKQEVLDGQQRLAAIRDFVRGHLLIDGSIEPLNEAIQALDGKHYSELPDEWRRRFDQFTIRVFRIVDYDPTEPAELFYRLNQPAMLTAAEQRNAFYGLTRTQVRDFVDRLIASGVDHEFVGFSNSRMAYDDVVARLCIQRERQTLAERVTSSMLASRYRGVSGFPEHVLESVSRGIDFFASARPFTQGPVRLNKATLFSWLWFATETYRFSDSWFPSERLGYVLRSFEDARTSRASLRPPLFKYPLLPTEVVASLLLIYTDRATSRVGDVSSILTRDIAIWAYVANAYDPTPPELAVTYKFNELIHEFSFGAQAEPSLASVSAAVDRLVKGER